MSSDAPVAIDVEGVGKQYRFGTGAEGRLGEMIQYGLRRMVGRQAPAQRETFWACKDISLQVRRGEVVGLIGRNGAGKSTMLKMLARITLPTEGRIVMHGRVASLLEVGAGFDPELSGRENVFLSGAILGMRTREIAEKFDEIVEFSGVERFIDTPVKRYSSGMFVRLAFAVGAHLESDILLVDEVLAVGDSEFQQKCLGKMESVAEAGRTVVFVSHNLIAVQRLCTRAYLLEQGRLVAEGPTSEVVHTYLDRVGARQEGAQVDVRALERPGIGGARINRVAFVDSHGEQTDRLHYRQRFGAVVEIEATERIPDAIFQIGVSDAEGNRALTVHSTDGGRPPTDLEPGVHELRVDVDAGLLPGDFFLDVAVYRSNEAPVDHLDGALRFQVVNLDESGTDRYPLSWTRGAVVTPAEWSVSARNPGAVR